jgi:hypothetical protein
MTVEDVIAYAIKHTPQANAVIAALASKGYVIVPKEPTEWQIAAGWIDKEDVNPDDIYRAMLDAAPSPIRG